MNIQDMKYKKLEQELKQLREEYKTHPSDELKARGLEIRLLLVENFGCYTCDSLCSKTQIPNMFCSKECHEKWVDENYHANKYTRNMTVEEMQRKLKEFGQEARKKGFVS